MTHMQDWMQDWKRGAWIMLVIALYGLGAATVGGMASVLIGVLLEIFKQNADEDLIAQMGLIGRAIVLLPRMVAQAYDHSFFWQKLLED